MQVIRRKDLAEWLSQEISVSLSEEDAHGILTRSEAAQVLAEFLVARAVGKASGVRPTLEWAHPKPVGSPPSEDLSMALLPPSERWWMNDHGSFRGWFD
jgi:hypothetical protein